MESRPISEIKLPKVTVCPPKNTYTDLNYDLMLAENKPFADNLRDDLNNHAKKLVDDHTFMNDIDKLQEEDRYYNWYHGFTITSYSYTHNYYDWLQMDYKYNLVTSATAGVVTTQYYGEQFQPHLVERNIIYYISVYPPESVRDNSDVTLHFKLDKAMRNIKERAKQIS